MAEREKVISGLEHCIPDPNKSLSERMAENECRHAECPYGGKEYEYGMGCFWDLLSDALELLKEQEAKQAIKQTYHVMMNRDYENPVEVTRYDWLCPTCKSLLCRDIDVIDDNYHFCKVCGQAVRWE